MYMLAAWIAQLIKPHGSPPPPSLPSQLPVQTLCFFFSPVVQSHASTSVYTLKIPDTGIDVPLSGHTEILHTPIGMSSTALAAAVPYPGKAIRISRKGPCSTKTKV